LIARQRQNLRHTFLQAEQPVADSQACQRLAQTERALAEAALEFTAGLEARFGPIPCLHEAHEAMQSAVLSLEQKNVKTGGASEETALAGLIRARQNVRKLLSDSQCASACRKFDAQQKQKLRKPPKKDDKAELAKLQEQIEKLAQEEKELAQEIGAKAGSGSKSSQTDRQEKAAQQADELRKLVRKDEGLTELARERMDAAADAVGESAKSLRSGREKEASRQAAGAAEQLDRLARQVAGLKAAELTARLAHSQALARRIARQQQTLAKELQGKSGGDKQARGQRGAMEEARTLADLLKRLQADAAGTNPQLGEALRQAKEANPPSDIVEQMRRAAEALQSGQSERARRDIDRSERMLGALAQQLEAAHRGLVQPQLAKLIAAEKQAAATQQALDAVHNERQKAESEKKVADLRDAMEALRPADGKLAEAAAALGEAARGGGAWTRREKRSHPSEGAYVPPVEYTESVQKVVKALQARIQEIILTDALFGQDEPVPPQYKALVEEYYRVLSEDLR